MVGFILSSDKTEASWKKDGLYSTKGEVLFFILCICLGLTTNYTGNWNACISNLTINISYQQAQVPWNIGKLFQSLGPWCHQICWK